MNYRGVIGLALFLAGTYSAFSISARETLADVPWEYLPAETARVSGAAYRAAFFPIAEGYLALADGAAEIQAEAYRATGQVVAAAAAVLGKTKPVAAAAQWYVDASRRVEGRLRP